MITANKAVQLGTRYQNPCADASYLQLFVGEQIVQRSLTDREKFSCFLAANKQLVIDREWNSAGTQ
jgi:hypothetical protein